MAQGVVDEFWRDRVADRLFPFLLDVINGATHAHTVYFTISCQPANQNGCLIFAASAIMNIGKEKCLAFRLFHATLKLPADQRMHLTVFINRSIDFYKQITFTQDCNMLVEVVVGAGHRYLR